MPTVKSTTRINFYPRFLGLVALLIALLPAAAYAGNGTYKSGKFDFCVSIRFNATADELQRIQAAFQQGSDILADATDGQHRFGAICFLNNDTQGSMASEYWISKGEPITHATFGLYGVRGEHIVMDYQRDFVDSPQPDKGAFTVAHEFAHHAYNILDEYKGPGGNAECAPLAAESPTLSYCLMDTYLARGGGKAGLKYTLDEFCYSGNHDPDKNTFQSVNRGTSCWEQISGTQKLPGDPKGARKLTAPAGAPVAAAPASQAVTFQTGAAKLRVMLVIDRSGSMDSEQRLVYAKLAANQFIDFLSANDALGIVSFSDSAVVNMPLTNITGSATQSQAKAAVNSLVADGSTNITGGLQSALSQLTSQSQQPSCNDIIVLLTDGDHNVGATPDTVIPALQAARVTTLTIGVGNGVSASGQATLQSIANQTGGKYFAVGSSSDLVGLLTWMNQESKGRGMLVRAPLNISAGQVKDTPATVETGAESVLFVVTIADTADKISMSLVTPSGNIITPAQALPNSNIEYISSSNSLAFRVTAPEAGNWRIRTTSGVISTGKLEVLGFAEDAGTFLNIVVKNDTPIFPEGLEIQASPWFKGKRVVGVSVTGFLIAPTGYKSSVILYDDGLASHGDVVANDGVYSARTGVNQYSGNGTYTLQLNAVNVNGKKYSGENLFGTATSDISVPAFTRTSVKSIVVTGLPEARFSSSSYSVNEGGTSATVTVTRSGNLTLPATVDYFTSDDTAEQRSDYTIASGTLSFAAGETTKTFTVLVTDNAYVDGTRRVLLTLSSPTGAGLSTPNTALLFISDNDTNTATTNPIDAAQFFVRQHYYDFLNRAPDQGGLDYWSAQITQCGSDVNCINSRRIGVSAAYFIELEFQDTGFYVYRFHKASYGQRPNYAQFMPDRSRVVGGANLEAGKQAFAEAWVQRPEFIDKYPLSLSGAQFIDALLQTVQQGVGVDLSSQRATLLNDYNSNGSRARIVRMVVEDPTLSQAEYNKAFVIMQYFGYLRRDPDEGGYQFWLDVLNNRVVNNYHGMVCAFITSAEYQDRFSSVRTRNDTICPK